MHFALTHIKPAKPTLIKKRKGRKIKWWPTLYWMKKHAHSGIAINQSVSQQRTREFNREEELLKISRDKRKGTMFSNVLDLFRYRITHSHNK